MIEQLPYILGGKASERKSGEDSAGKAVLGKPKSSIYGHLIRKYYVIIIQFILGCAACAVPNHRVLDIEAINYCLENKLGMMSLI